MNQTPYAFTSATELAISPRAASAYCLRRTADTRALAAQILAARTDPTAMPYATLHSRPDGAVLVNDHFCASLVCAMAYILAKWW